MCFTAESRWAGFLLGSHSTSVLNAFRGKRLPPFFFFFFFFKAHHSYHECLDIYGGNSTNIEKHCKDLEFWLSEVSAYTQCEDDTFPSSR